MKRLAMSTAASIATTLYKPHFEDDNDGEYKAALDEFAKSPDTYWAALKTWSTCSNTDLISISCYQKYSEGKKDIKPGSFTTQFNSQKSTFNRCIDINTFFLIILQRK